MNKLLVYQWILHYLLSSWMYPLLFWNFFSNWRLCSQTNEELIKYFYLHWTRIRVKSFVLSGIKNIFYPFFTSPNVEEKFYHLFRGFGCLLMSRWRVNFSLLFGFQFPFRTPSHFCIKLIRNKWPNSRKFYKVPRNLYVSIFLFCNFPFVQVWWFS